MGASSVLAVLVLAMLFLKAESCGPSVGFPSVDVLETAEPGAVIDKMAAEAGVTWSITFKDTEQFPQRSISYSWLKDAIDINATTGTDHHFVVLKRQLDLETNFKRWQTKVSHLEYEFTCADAAGESKKFSFIIKVVPVDEYTPRFVDGPYVLRIRENAPLDIPLLTLQENATDEDVVPDLDSDISNFTMKAILQPGQTKAMEGFFKLTDAKKGLVFVDKSLDFEGFPDPENAFMIYQLTVYDTGNRHNSTDLTIYVEDVDDEAPEFYHPGCDTSPCDVVYMCDVPYDFTGPIKDMSPAPIFAKDRDTMNNKVAYRMRSGPPKPRFRKHLQMDEDTGQITVIEPLAPYNKKSIEITIRATEKSRSKGSVDTDVIINIKYPAGYVFPQDQSTTTPAPAPAEEKDTSKTIVVAAVGLGTFILIAFISLGVLMVYMKKRGEKPIYPASEADDVDDDTTDSPVTPVTPVTATGQRGAGGSNSSSVDSGRSSMKGDASARPKGVRQANGKTAVQKRAPGEGGAVGAVGAKKAVRAKKTPPGAKGARRIGSARSDTSVGKQSKISIGDIHPQDDPDQAMMFQEHMELAAMQGAFPEGAVYMDDNGMYVDENGMYVDGGGMYLDENGMYTDENGMYLDGSMYHEGGMAMAQYGEEDETDFGQSSMQQAPRRPRPPKSAPPGKRGKALKTPKRPQSGIANRKDMSSSNAQDDDEF